MAPKPLSLLSPLSISRASSSSPPPLYSPMRHLSPSPSPTLPMWSSPRLQEKGRAVSFTELAASSTKSKISKFLRPKLLVTVLLTTLCMFWWVMAVPGFAENPFDSPPAASSSGVPLKARPHHVPQIASPYADRKHLVVVAGHAIWKGGPTLGEVDDEWTLEPYQRGHNESEAWIAHIEKGVELLKSKKNALLVFSGGETRPSSGPRSESQSYWSLAEARGLLTPDLFPLATTELFARDSFENLLFSICRFKEYTGVYPESLTVVGYEFKRRRFEHVHRAAILFPRAKFDYVGIDPTNATLVEEMRHFELTNSLAPFEKDPYGCIDDILIQKKGMRGWAGRGAGAYEQSCPELSELLSYCGQRDDGSVQLYNGALPWSH